MSATGRGAIRNEKDFYATPLDAFLPLLLYLPKNRSYWEPACGDERLIKAMRENGFACFGDDIRRAGYNFLHDQGRKESILTNPPFSLAFEFMQHARELSDHVVLLLRLNFLGSKKRREWWKKNKPSALYILSKRPSFKEGGTDCTEYAWFEWTGDKGKRFGTDLIWL